MFAHALISNSIPPVKPSDRAGMVLDWMGEFKVNQLPVVDKGKFIGLVVEDDVLHATDPDETVEEITRAGWENAYVNGDAHIYDVLALMSSLKLEVLPVLDEASLYLGVITLRDISEYLGQLFAIHEPGGILTLQVASNSYVPSEISRIAESVDVKVLSFYVAPSPDSQELQVTVKVNAEDLSRLMSAFERYSYKIVHAVQRGSRRTDLQENLDAFIRFLNM